MTQPVCDVCQFMLAGCSDRLTLTALRGAPAAFVWAWRFQQFERSPKRQLFGVTVGIAKACGNVMKLVTWPLVLIPVSRNLMTWLRCGATRTTTPCVVAGQRSSLLC